MLLALLLSFFFSTKLQLQAQITGPISVCFGEEVNYSSSISGNSYQWWLTGGSYTTFNSGNGITVLWNDPGASSANTSIHLNLVDALGQITSYSLNVSVLPSPESVIQYVEPIPANSKLCSGRHSEDGIENPDTDRKESCIQACEFMEMTYTVPFDANSTYAWTAQGGNIIGSSINHSVLIEWGAAGQGFIEVKETNQYGCESTEKFCVDILDSPTADFNASTTDACLNQTVNFFDISTDAYTWHWDFGDGNTSTDQNPSHAYNSSGFYTVVLTATNKCGCTDTQEKFIKVDNLKGPIIECASTLCAYDSEAYWTTDVSPCGVYDWQVTGGNIVSPPPYGQNIQVDWGGGPVGTVSLSFPCGGIAGYCPSPSQIVIPLIGGNLNIAGVDPACYQSYELYQIPEFMGATCTWNITGTDNVLYTTDLMYGGSTLNNTNQVLVFWQSDGTLSVDVSHTLLDCSSSASLNVEVKPDFVISSPAPICEGEALNLYSNANNESIQWQIEPGGYSTVGFGSPFTWSPPLNPGTYIITGTLFNTNNFCNLTTETTFEVVAPPATPIAINGERGICPNTTYFYQAVANPLLGNLAWTIHDGVTISNVSGNPIAITWSSAGPYVLSVKQVSTDSPNCESKDYIATDFQPVTLNGLVNGDTDVCTNEAKTYTIGSPIPNVVYDWSITPSNLGSIVLGQGTNSIDVQWHNQVGTANMSVEACGITENLSVNINAISSTPSIVSSADLCVGGSINLIASAGFAQYEWLDGTGTSLGINSSNTFNVTTGGNYSVIVTDSDGCTQISDPFYVHENQAPTANISTPDSIIYCNGTSVSTTLYALESTGYTYLWNTGATTSTIATTSIGTYTVTVTNSAGCTNTASIEVISNACPTPNPGDPPPCTNDYTLTTSLVGSSSCNEFEFIALPATAMTYSFDLDDGTGASGNSNMVTHAYNEAGFYQPSMQVTNPAGSCPVFEVITVPIAANFDVITSCVGNATQFIDASTYLPGYSISSWGWDVDGDAVTDYTSANPLHTYSNSGTYNVTLTVTSNTGCTATVTKLVEIAPLPAANFNVPSNACLFEAINFADVSTGNIVQWAWDFGGGAISNLANVSHAYTSTGSFTATLSVTDATGCSDTYSQTVSIATPLIGGTINVSANSICQGDVSILTAPLGNGYLWSNGSTAQSISVAQAGIYFVEVEDFNGCHYSTPPEVITVIPLPDAEISGSQEICKGDDILLTTAPNANYTYIWSGGGSGAYSPNPNEYYDNSLGSGTWTYYLTVIDNNTGCKANSLPFTVVVHDPPPPPVVSASNNNFCEGETAILTASGYDPNTSSLQWSTGETSQAIEVETNGYYTVKVTDKNGCTNSWGKYIEVYPLPNLKTIPVGCYEINCPDTLCAPSGYASYLWETQTATGINTFTDPCIYLDEDGIYTLTVKGWNGCQSTASFELEVGNCSPCYNIEETATYQVVDGSDYPDGRVITPSSPEFATIFNSGGGIYFKGHLIIQDFILNISNMHFVFEEGAKMTFRNSTVNFNNSVFEPCEECDTWRGMEFEEFAYGQFNECVLKNAEIAMDVHSRQGLRISNNEFINCHTSIYLHPNPFLRYSYDEGITGNTFLVDRFCDDLFEDTEYFGVHLESLYMTGLVSQNDFINSSYANNDYLKFYGVRAVRGVSATISQNIFSNLFRSIDISEPIAVNVENNWIETTKGLYPDALDIGVLDGYYHQIRISDAVQSKYIEVFGNTIQSSQNFADIQTAFTNNNFSSSAIYVSKSKQINIRGNTIEGYRTGIMMISTTHSQISDNGIDGAYTYGIYLKDINKVNVACNVINMDRLQSNKNVVGIGYLRTYEKSKNEIYSNCIFESSIGMLFQNYGAKQRLPYIRNNYLYNYDSYGMYIVGFGGNLGNANPNTYQQYGRNTFIANSTAYDVWSFPATIAAHGNYGINTVYNVKVKQPILPSTASCGHQIIDDRIDTHEFISTEVCNKLTPILYLPVKRVGDKWAMEDDYGSVLGELEEAERLTFVVTLMEFLAENEDDYLSLDKFYEEVASGNLLSQTSRMWLSYYHSMAKHEHTSAKEQLTLLLLQKEVGRDCVFVEDLQLQIKMKVLEVKDLTEQQVERLKEIDNSDGACAVSARDLLHSSVKGYDYLFERGKTVDIEAQIADLPNNLLEINQITVYPNPAKDLVNISFNRAYDEQTAVLQVFAIDGRLLKEEEVMVYRGQIQLDVSELLDGVYILSLQSEDALPVATKFHKLE